MHYPFYYFQNYERMNLADALISKSFQKGERIIQQGELSRKHLQLLNCAHLLLAKL